MSLSAKSFRLSFSLKISTNLVKTLASFLTRSFNSKRIASRRSFFVSLQALSVILWYKVSVMISSELSFLARSLDSILDSAITSVH